MFWKRSIFIPVSNLIQKHIKVHAVGHIFQEQSLGTDPGNIRKYLVYAHDNINMTLLSASQITNPLHA